jgi:hypothetical protein
MLDPYPDSMIQIRNTILYKMDEHTGTKLFIYAQSTYGSPVV